MPDDPRQALVAFITQMAAMPREDRASLVSRSLPLLADPHLPVAFRLAAAARLLRLVPDRPRPVRRIARALTRGLTPSRALERLRQLQHQVEKCEALDAFINQREERVRLACPRCGIKLPRMEMVKHLWHEHGLSLEQGKVRAAARQIDDLRERHRTTRDSESLDRVVALTGTAGIRQWLAADEAPAEEIEPLLTRAREHGAGLCPGCFTELPAAVLPLPDPLLLTNGRLAGDGYAVAVGGNAWLDMVRITTPGTTTSVGEVSLAPRALATLAATGILAVVLLIARSLPFAAGGITLALIVYLVVRGMRSLADSLEDRAVDAAWVRFAPRLADRPQTARFLTRLCLASADWGDPEVRARVLNTIIERAAGKADESDAELQLLAAARVLQVEDLSRYGRDGVAGIAALAAEGLKGTLPADYAELVVGCYLGRPRDPGSLARLRVLLIGAAFDAGLAPRDLLDIWAGAPNLRRAMVVEPTHRLGLLHGLWRTRLGKAWEAVGAAETVFDLARTAPPTAARILARFPDLLLLHHPEPVVEQQLGPVLICARGVAVEGYLTADPDAEVQLREDGRELVFGRHRITVTRPLSADLTSLLTKWLAFRADVLVPFIDAYLSPASADGKSRVLGPFCRRCLVCGTVSAVSRGAVGRAATD